MKRQCLSNDSTCEIGNSTNIITTTLNLIKTQGVVYYSGQMDGDSRRVTTIFM
jgi:hypothetical protein